MSKIKLSEASAYVRYRIAGRPKPPAVIIDGEWYIDV